MSLYIFDKDTICRSKSGEKFINSPDDQELFPGVKEKVDELKAYSHKIAIASNQGGVAFGYMTQGMAYKIMEHASRLIEADKFIFCPYHPKGTVRAWSIESNYRKPGPGMIFSLITTFAIKIKEVIFIGDRPEDKQAAKNAGVKFAWADDFFERGENNA